MLNKINICQPFDLHTQCSYDQKRYLLSSCLQLYWESNCEREEFHVKFKTILNFSNYLNQKQDFFLVPVTPKRVMKVYSKLFVMKYFHLLTSCEQKNIWIGLTSNNIVKCGSVRRYA